MLYIKAKDLLSDPEAYLDKRNRIECMEVLDALEDKVTEDAKLFAEVTRHQGAWGDGELERLRSRIDFLEGFCFSLCTALLEETRDKLLAEQGWVPYTDYTKQRLELLREEYKPRPKKGKSK